MTHYELLTRIAVDPSVCGGEPCIRGTRVPIAVLLSGLSEGMTIPELCDHYPQLTNDDVRAALAYASELAHENTWKLAV